MAQGTRARKRCWAKQGWWASVGEETGADAAVGGGHWAAGTACWNRLLETACWKPPAGNRLRKTACWRIAAPERCWGQQLGPSRARDDSPKLLFRAAAWLPPAPRALNDCAWGPSSRGELGQLGRPHRPKVGGPGLALSGQSAYSCCPAAHRFNSAPADQKEATFTG